MKNNIDGINGDNVRTDKVTAELVERGLAFHHAPGCTVATACLREHAVLAEEIHRNFGSVHACRPARPVRRRWR